jgi:MFS family permease
VAAVVQVTFIVTRENVGGADNYACMPTIPHEAPLELLRRDPRLAEVLVASLGVAVPPGATAQMLTTNWVELTLALIVSGIGISMALPTVPTAVLNAVAPEEMGKASGISYMAQRLGAVFAIAVSGGMP